MDSVDFFRVVNVRGIKALQKFWPFLREGLFSLNKISADNRLTEEQLFRLCVDVALLDGTGKILIVLDSSTGAPLSYTISTDNSNKYTGRRSLLVLAIYSNGKSRTATRYGLNEHAKLAREEGYVELHGYSSRITGAAVRLFETIFSFKKHSLFLIRKL